MSKPKKPSKKTDAEIEKRGEFLISPKTLANISEEWTEINHSSEKNTLRFKDFLVENKDDESVQHRQEFLDKLHNLALNDGLKSGYALTDSLSKNYQGLAYEMRKSFLEEFDCQKAHEKALVDQIVNAYARKMHLSKMMMTNQSFSYYEGERTNHFYFLSKEIDRAHRQFLSALETLQALKQPPLKINLRAHNAFLAQNQQLNNQQEQAGQKNKNNESK
jgi:hypothetical protein